MTLNHNHCHESLKPQELNKNQLENLKLKRLGKYKLFHHSITGLIELRLPYSTRKNEGNVSS